MNKSFIATALLTVSLSLTACGGGGASSSVPTVVYPMSGTYVGLIIDADHASNFDNFAISVANNSSNPNGGFAIQAPQASDYIAGLAWPSANGHVDGNHLTTVSVLGDCTYAIDAQMENANELDGTLTVSNCGTENGTAKFSATRDLNVQDVLKKVPNLQKYMSVRE